ncbi:hypothetical protein NDU88_003335 [Pleurodeles waltl]|uniref:Uncharacterized protein n=1 Tax=Pleurodeles waltl TaxID=8319 RepID=A0AAV7UDS2_PLEWA|nr:hypothetical protein NDU88_003335 [Pleurodeles waltl]
MRGHTWHRAAQSVSQTLPAPAERRESAGPCSLLRSGIRHSCRRRRTTAPQAPPPRVGPCAPPHYISSHAPVRLRSKHRWRIRVCGETCDPLEKTGDRHSTEILVSREHLVL